MPQEIGKDKIKQGVQCNRERERLYSIARQIEHTIYKNKRGGKELVSKCSEFATRKGKPCWCSLCFKGLGDKFLVCTVVGLWGWGHVRLWCQPPSHTTFAQHTHTAQSEVFDVSTQIGSAFNLVPVPCTNDMSNKTMLSVHMWGLARPSQTFLIPCATHFVHRFCNVCTGLRRTLV